MRIQRIPCLQTFQWLEQHYRGPTLNPGSYPVCYTLVRPSSHSLFQLTLVKCKSSLLIGCRLLHDTIEHASVEWDSQDIVVDSSRSRLGGVSVRHFWRYTHFEIKTTPFSIVFKRNYQLYLSNWSFLNKFSAKVTHGSSFLSSLAREGGRVPFCVYIYK